MALPDDYVKAINEAPKIWLVIMGKDPYPTAPQGIPFVKSTWEEMLNRNCSGRYVLESLGFPVSSLSAAELTGRYDEPRQLFLNLASSGIVFLNLSYEIPDKDAKVSWDKMTHLAKMEEADLINAPYCNVAWLVILCGQAKERWRLPSHAHTQSIETVHPSIQCSVHQEQRIKDGWHTWWSQDVIFNWVKPVPELRQILSLLRGG